MFTRENSIVVVGAANRSVRPHALPQAMESLESRALCSATFASVESEFERAGLPTFASQSAIHVDARRTLSGASSSSSSSFSASWDSNVESPMKRAPRQVTNVVGTWVGTYRIGKGRDGGSVEIVITGQSRKRVIGTIVIDGEALSGSASFSVDKKGNFVAKDSGDGWSAKLTGKLNRNATAATGKWSYAEAGEKTLKGTFQLHRV